MPRDPVAAALGLVENAQRALASWTLPPVPDPLTSNREAARFAHEDLPGMSAEMLAKERIVARLAWALPGAEPWWTGRVRAIEAELARRRARR